MHFNVRKLEKIRSEKKIGVHQMARRIGISHQKYYDLLNKYGSPKLDTIDRIAKNLNIDPRDLVEFD